MHDIVDMYTLQVCRTYRRVLTEDQAYNGGAVITLRFPIWELLSAICIHMLLDRFHVVFVMVDIGFMIVRKVCLYSNFTVVCKESHGFEWIMPFSNLSRLDEAPVMELDRSFWYSHGSVE